MLSLDKYHMLKMSDLGLGAEKNGLVKNSRGKKRGADEEHTEKPH